jgi:glycosyltransferase involved in cell wall biosynthesis
MKVSVVTPSYNQGVFIGRTLQSVADQSGAEIEHVVFDGGSQDETIAVLKAFPHKIRWVSEKDGGQTDAVNKGIRATDGEIIGWLNSDDVYYPEAIARVVAFFTAHPEVEIVYGMADHIDEKDKAFEDYPTEPWNFEQLKQTCFICQPAVFFRRSVVAKHGLLDDKLNFCMDYEYWLRLGKAGVKFGFLEHKLAGSRLYADNKTLGSRVRVHAEINDVMKAKFGKVPDRWIWNYAHAVVEARRDRASQPWRFDLYLMTVAIGASLYWNREIAPGMRPGLKDLWARVRHSDPKRLIVKKIHPRTRT